MNVRREFLSDYIYTFRLIKTFIAVARINVSARRLIPFLCTRFVRFYDIFYTALRPRNVKIVNSEIRATALTRILREFNARPKPRRYRKLTHSLV